MQSSFINGKIYTGNPSAPWAESILVEDGRIKAVGSTAEITSLLNPGDSQTELNGKCVIPGFVDSHCHFVKRGLSLEYVDLNGLKSIEGCRDKIKKAIDKAPKDSWIIGFGWNENNWEDGRLPLASDLDDIAPANPVMLNRVCHHAIWVNSLALKIAGITSLTPNPPGGLIEKDEISLNPTGIIKEARYLVDKFIPQPTLVELKKAALAAQNEVIQYGITSVHSNESLREYAALEQLDSEKKLSIRILHSFPADQLDQVVEKGYLPTKGSNNLWHAHIKIFADGSLGAKTAYMHEPYENEASCGLPFLNQEELISNVQAAHKAGFGVAIHAIGDKAVTNSIDAIEPSSKRDASTIPDRIEHIQLFKTEDLQRFVDLNIFASVQPIFLSSDMLVAEKVWGEKRCANAYAWKSLLDAGIQSVFGSDAPIEPCNPILGIHSAVNRTRIDQNPVDNWHPEQALTVEECIKSFTLTPAILAGKDHITGTIEEGKFADFAVLSDDIFSIEKEKIKSVQCELTVISGNTVFQSS